MDQKSREYLDKILTKDPEILNEGEIRFLRARRDYLKKSQLEEYDSVLNPVKVKTEEPEKKVEDQTSDKETVKENAKT